MSNFILNKIDFYLFIPYKIHNSLKFDESLIKILFDLQILVVLQDCLTKNILQWHLILI